MSCTLCDLPTPDPPVTDDDVDGTFCCRGCLEVARALDDPATADAADARAAVGRDADGAPSATAGEDSIEAAADDDADVAYLRVDGMHCATCEVFLESEATATEGVHSAAASYPAGLVKLVYDPGAVDRADLPDLVDGPGYRARHADGARSGPATAGEDGTESAAAGEDGTESAAAGEDGTESAAADEDGTEPAPHDGDDRTSVGRLLVGGFFGMMTMAWYVLFLYPTYLGLDPDLLVVDLSTTAGTYILLNVWVFATVVLGYTGVPILRGAYVSLRTGRPNMDLLVALAATAAYVYSAGALLVGHAEVYFDVSVVIVLAVSLGTYYERRLRRGAAGRFADLVAERATEARRRGPDGTEIVPVETLAAGDEVVVKPGERVPVDGTVREGTAAVDESLVTGESLPVRAEPGEAVVGGAVVADGSLVVAVDAGGQSTLDRVLSVLWDVRSTRGGVQRLADRLAAVFVPVVLVVAAAATGWQVLAGASLSTALLTGLAVLVVSCPCALGLATPLAVSAGVRDALRQGVVVTEGDLFERAPDADVIALDKTGTLTTGDMRVVGTAGDDRSLARAAAVEQFADHPIAEAVVDAAGPVDADATDVRRHPGRGVSGTVDGTEILVGRPLLFASRDWTVPSALDGRCSTAREAGHVPVLVGWDGRAEGLVVVGDRPRPEWRSVVDDLADRAGRVVLLSGDSPEAAAQFREHPGVDEVFAGVPPEGKSAVVERLRAEGTTVMVGDGSNDAPALAAADLGIALGGTAMAADAADAVVTDDDLATVPEVFALTAAARRRIRENLCWAFAYNALAIPLAAAGLLNPLLAALAMAASSLLVVTNSLRPLPGGGRVDDDGGERSGLGPADVAASAD